MHLTTPALVLTALPHGEHGAVVRFFTPDDGVQAGYVRGGRSRALRPVLQPGNRVVLSLKARVESQLAAATVELTGSRAILAMERLSAASLDWLTALTAATLGEGVTQPGLYTGLDSLLEAMTAGAPPQRAIAGLARYELLLLTELGFGPDLSACAATGTTADLAYVSPRSSQAVSRAAGEPHAAKLLPLPGLLLHTDADPSWRDVRDALTMTGWFLERHLLTGRLAALLTARARLAAMLPLAGNPA